MFSFQGSCCFIVASSLGDSLIVPSHEHESQHYFISFLIESYFSAKNYVKKGAFKSRKVLVLLGLSVILLLFYKNEISSVIPVFHVTNEPNVISKGHYGQTLILEVSFSHDGFEQWLENVQPPYPLLVLHSDWIERSPSTIEIIQKKRLPTALLGNDSETYEIDSTIQKEIGIYEKHFGRKPLWFMTQDYTFSDELKQKIFAERVNMITPTALWQNDMQLSEGMIIAVPMHESSIIDFEQLTSFMQKQPFVSIEENLFGYTIKTKRFPQ
ncbi:hypothetical protein [Solibacillus sp. CAU 1738]|uniref:hypothetical protein n=1 Tax=Solibacillus sp. CAU 1738 TaxID=3140363 RepID=UPI003260C2CC